METIIPRWEWRTFGQGFGAADAKFAALASERVQQSDELYLLSPVSDANVKVRDALMDVKLLEQVNAAGLEQWRPVMKGEFPLPAAEVKKVCEALGVALPSTARAAYALEELEAELIAPARGVRVVQVHKRRVRYTINGCISEMTDVVADGHTTRTVALESEDADRVVECVGAMGLAVFQNISYPRGLKQLIAMKG